MPLPPTKKLHFTSNKEELRSKDLKYLFKVILFHLFFSLMPLSSWACSCVGNISFCELVLTKDQDERYIIKGRKIKSVDHGMEVKVLESYGKGLSSSQITVWGDLGWLCRSYVSGFRDGDEFIMILDKLKEGTFYQPYEEFGESEAHYSLSICGEHYLIINGDKVEGGLTGVKDLEVIEAFLTTRELDFCEIDHIKTRIVPNPAVLSVSIFSPIAYKEVKMYNSIGQLVRTKSGDNLFNVEFDVRDIPAGVYFIELVYTDRFSKFDKLVVI